MIDALVFPYLTYFYLLLFTFVMVLLIKIAYLYVNSHSLESLSEACR